MILELFSSQESENLQERWREVMLYSPTTKKVTWRALAFPSQGGRWKKSTKNTLWVYWLLSLIFYTQLPEYTCMYLCICVDKEGFESHPVVFRSYFWLCAQESLLQLLRGLCAVPTIKAGCFWGECFTLCTISVAPKWYVYIVYL